MRKWTFGFIVAGLAVFVAPRVARADVTPASVFIDHMVPQRGKPVPVWGTATPGERVTVAIAGQTQSTDASGDGKWMVRLNDLPVGGPYTLAIVGKNSIKLDDVLVGEVWLCSGQSNMDFT